MATKEFKYQLPLTEIKHDLLRTLLFAGVAVTVLVVLHFFGYKLPIVSNLF